MYPDTSFLKVSTLRSSSFSVNVACLMSLMMVSNALTASLRFRSRFSRSLFAPSDDFAALNRSFSRLMRAISSPCAAMLACTSARLASIACDSWLNTSSLCATPPARTSAPFTSTFSAMEVSSSMRASRAMINSPSSRSDPASCRRSSSPTELDPPSGTCAASCSRFHLRLSMAARAPSSVSRMWRWSVCTFDSMVFLLRSSARYSPLSSLDGALRNTTSIKAGLTP